MKLRVQTLLRLVLALLLLGGAALGAILIKDTLAMRNPQSVMPTFTVDYEGRPLPSKHVMTDAYEWHFLTKARPVVWQEVDRDYWRNMDAAPVLPNSPLEIHFSYEADSYEVTRMAENGSQFEELRGQLRTPDTPGEVYTYKVEAHWDDSTVWYYFKIQVAKFD